jgi:hypothetical protein
MFLKHVNEKVPRVGKIVSDVPAKFESLIIQLLEKDKEDRPIDAAWVARMLQEVEEDAFARKSVGLAKAEARTAKPLNQGGEKMDAADREAARALRGKKRKGKKKQEVPLLERKWVQALGLLAGLALIAGGAYYALKPTPPEKLYAAIEKAETPEAKLAAATKFLESHGAKGGEMVDKAAAVFREGKVREREKQLKNRQDANLSRPAEADDPEAYNAAWAALEAERDGRLDQAESQWIKVKGRFPEEAKLPFATKEGELAKARWGWLAEKRLADIAAARAEVERLKRKVTESRIHEQALPVDKTNPESLALKVIRLRAFGDQDRAARDCDTLVALTEKDPDKHVWYLVATSLKLGLARGGDAAVTARLARIDHWLDATEVEAKKLQTEPGMAVERRQVRNRCREIIELYSDDDEKSVRAAVEHAEKIAAMVPKQ